MDIKKLQRTIIDALEDVKAQDIRVYDSSKLSELFDRVIIATGNSNRQTRSLALSVKEKVLEKGGEVISIEGLETGEWVLWIAVILWFISCNPCSEPTTNWKGFGEINRFGSNYLALRS